MEQAQVEGVRIRWEEAGGGEPALLCLPGWCLDHGIFERLIPLLAPRHRTMALDWRGHGQSGVVAGDFGMEQLVEDALAVIRASGARTVVPLAAAHAGWVGIELRRRLGARVPALALLDWIVCDPPPSFIDALHGLRDARHWRAVRDGLFHLWLATAPEEVGRIVRAEADRHGPEMWARAARAIEDAYRRHRNPLESLGMLVPPVPTLHLYAQPHDPGALVDQERFARTHPWFEGVPLEARSHFPSLEVPERVAARVFDFLDRWATSGRSYRGAGELPPS